MPNALNALAQAQPTKQPRNALMQAANPLYSVGGDGLVREGNIDLNRRPRINNKDGSFSTIESMSANINGVEVLLPTITPDGKRLTPEQAIQRHIQTGEHLGMFASPQLADAYAKKLSASQGQRYIGR